MIINKELAYRCIGVKELLLVVNHLPVACHLPK